MSKQPATPRTTNSTNRLLKKAHCPKFNSNYLSTLCIFNYFPRLIQISLKMMKMMNMHRSSLAVKASASGTAKAAPVAAKTTKALNITKSNLVGSQGGKATRNVDGIVSVQSCFF